MGSKVLVGGGPDGAPGFGYLESSIVFIRKLFQIPLLSKRTFMSDG
jgi:hypothetical protein